MSVGTSVEPTARAGRSELGTISIADGVVSKIAAQAGARVRWFRRPAAGGRCD